MAVPRDTIVAESKRKLDEAIAAANTATGIPELKPVTETSTVQNPSRLQPQSTITYSPESIKTEGLAFNSEYKSGSIQYDAIEAQRRAAAAGITANMEEWVEAAQSSLYGYDHWLKKAFIQYSPNTYSGVASTTQTQPSTTSGSPTSPDWTQWQNPLAPSQGDVLPSGQVVGQPMVHNVPPEIVQDITSVTDDRDTQNLYLQAINNAIAKGESYQWILDLMEDEELNVSELSYAELEALLGVGGTGASIEELPDGVEPVSPEALKRIFGSPYLESQYPQGGAPFESFEEPFSSQDLVTLIAGLENEPEAFMSALRQRYRQPGGAADVNAFMAQFYPNATEDDKRAILGLVSTEAEDLIDSIWAMDSKAIIGQLNFSDDLSVFWGGLRKEGRTPQTEELVSNLFPDATENDVRWMFGETPLLEYDDWIEWRNTRLWPWEKKIDDSNKDEPWAVEEYEGYKHDWSDDSDFVRTLKVFYGGGISLAADTIEYAAHKGWFGDDGLSDTLRKVSSPMLSAHVADLDPTTFDYHDIWAGLIENAAPTVSLMFMSVISYVALKGVATPVIGEFGAYLLAALGGNVFSTTGESFFEAASTYNQYLQKYPDDIDGADKAAQNVFDYNMKLLGASNMAEFLIAFFPGGKGTKNVLKAASRGWVKPVFDKTGKILSVAIIEGGQELLQEIRTRTALGEEVVLDDEMKLVMILGALQGGAFAVGGDIYTNFTKKVVNNLEPETKQLVVDSISEKVAGGMSEEDATQEAMNEFITSNEPELKAAIEKTKAETELDDLEQSLIGGTTYYRGEGEAQESFREGTFLTTNEEEAKQYGKVTAYKITPKNPLNVETASAAQMLGVQEEYDTAMNSGKQVEADNIVARAAKEQGYDAIIYADGTQAQVIDRSIIQPTSKTKLPPTKRKQVQAAIDKKRAELNKTKEVTSSEILAREPTKPTKTLEEISKQVKKEGKGTVGAMAWGEFYANKEESHQAIKTQLVDYINARVPTAVRGKLLTAVKNAKTFNDLDKSIKRANKIAEEYGQKELRAKIRKELRATSPRKVRGILKGRFTAEVQERIDILKANLNMDRDEARGKIASNIKSYDEGTLSPQEMQESNEMLDMAGIDGMTTTELASVLDYLNSLKNIGKSDRASVRERETERLDAIRSSVNDVLTGGKGLKAGIGTVPAEQLEIQKGWIDKLVNWQYSLTNIMDKLSKFHKSAPYQSPLNLFVDNTVLNARNAENAGRNKIVNEIKRNFGRIFNIKTNRKINHLLNQFKEVKIDLGTFTNLDGVELSLLLTKDQIINKYHQLQDPTLERTFEEGMRWTQEIKDAVVNNLTEQEKAWADYQMEFYQTYYHSINKVYSAVYNVDLPRNRFYSPINRAFDTKLPENILTYQDASRYASAKASGTLARVNSKSPLLFSSATDVMINHIQEMEHFKAWAQPMRDLRAVLGNKEVRTAIKQYHGAPILKIIDSYLNDMARGGVEKASTNKIMDALRRNFTLSILGLKPNIALKQIPSAIAYSTEMPFGDFITGVADFWTNPVSHTKFLIENSTYLRERFGAGHERDVHLAMQKSATKTLSGMGNVRDWFMALIRMGDAFAVTQGSWAKYRSSIKAGKTQAEAIAAAEMTTRRTQPTFDLEALSSLQKGNSLLKLLTMFQNQPGQYFRIMGTNARNFQYGRGNRAKAIANLALVWIVAPALFQLIADAFQFKKEHQLRAWILGPANYVLIFSQIAQSIYGWITDEPFDYQASPVMQSAREIQMGVQKIMKLINQGKDPYSDINVEDLIAAIEYFVKAGGELAGYPTPWLVQAERGLRSGEPLEIIFSRWSLQPPNESDNKKAEDLIGNLGKTEIDIKLESDNVDTRRSAEDELRKREDDLEAGLTPEPLDVYGMNDLDSDFGSLYDKVLPSQLISDSSTSDLVKSWAEQETLWAEAGLLPNGKLYKNYEDIDELKAHYKEWQARLLIDNLPELKDFDNRFSDAYKGNITRKQYESLLGYFGAEDQDQYLEDHPELEVNLRGDFVSSTPHDNAVLSLWGKVDIQSKEAYAEFKKLKESLGIPDSVLGDLGIPPDNMSEDYFEWLSIKEDFGTSSAQAKLFRINNPELNEWLKYKLPKDNIKALEIQIKYYDNYKQLDEYLEIARTKPNVNAEDVRRAYYTQYPLFRQATYLEEAYSKGYPNETLISNYVNYKEIIFKHNGNASTESNNYLKSHPAYDAFRCYLDKTAKPKTKTAEQLLAELIKQDPLDKYD